jgi:PAS domain S-box-containing protein
LAIALVFAVLVLLGVLVWRERRAAALTRAADQLEGIVRDSRFAERVRTGGPAGRLADNANRLLEQMAMRDLMINERERSLVGLLGGLHEALAVHREHVVFANDRFASLVGSNDARRLEGKAFPELVHPDYTDLVREHLRRSLAGEPGLERLEVELHPQSGQTARAELSAVRIDYQGGPALLLNLIEMGPRAAAVPLPSRAASAASAPATVVGAS